MGLQRSDATECLEASVQEGPRKESQNSSVLIVDDDPAATRLLSLFFRRTPFSCTTACSGTEAVRRMEEKRYEAVISDLRMPGMSGLDLLAETRERFPHTAFIVTTGVEDVEVAILAMRSGADDYLVKPLSEDAVKTSLERALHKHYLEQLLDEYRQNLEKLVAERTEQLHRALEQVQRSYEETLQALGTAVDLRDGETAGHSWRVCRYAMEMASAMEVPENERTGIARAAYLHDIGKLAVPDRILLKPGPLTEPEWTVMRQHVQTGFDLLKTIPFLTEAAEIVLSHHERFDGRGYPHGLQGKEIPLGARIFSVADAFDALTSARPYRSASTLEEARQIIEDKSGSQFDPEVVEKFLQVPVQRLKTISEDRRHLPPSESDLIDAVETSR